MRARFAWAGVLLSLACTGKQPEQVSLPPSPELPAVEAAEPEAPARPAKLLTTSRYGCLLDEQGALWCWGRDPALAAGTRAKGDRAEQATRVEDLHGVVDIHGTDEKLCILGDAGELRCWFDELAVSIPVQLDRAATRVFVTHDELCLLDDVGTLRCGNPDTIIMNGFDRSVGREIAERVRDVDVAPTRSCALDEDGTIWCWGSWYGNKIRNLATIEGAVDIELDPNSAKRTIVRLDSGQLVEAMERHTGPVELRPLEGFTELAAFGVYDDGICVLGADRRVRCQGDNYFAQLGQAHTRASTEPLVVEALDAVEALDLGRDHACVIHDGDPWCWGLHQWDDFNQSDFHEADLDEVVSVVGRHDMVCASTAAGANLCWGSLVWVRSVDGGLVALSTPSPLSLSLGRLVDFTGPNGREFTNESERHCLRDAAGEVACVDMKDVDEWVSPSNWVESFRRSGLADFERLEQGWCGLSDGRLRCETDTGKTLALPQLRNVTNFDVAADDVLCAAHDGGKLSCFEVGRRKAKRVPGLDDVVSIDAGVQTVVALDGRGRVHRWHVLESLPKMEEVPPDTVYLYSTVAGPPWKFAIFGVERHVEFDAMQQIEFADRGMFGDALYGLGLDGTITYEATPPRTLPLRDVVQITGTDNGLCALTKHGRVACQGKGEFGTLGRLPRNLILGPREMVLARE